MDRVKLHRSCVRQLLFADESDNSTSDEYYQPSPKRKQDISSDSDEEASRNVELPSTSSALRSPQVTQLEPSTSQAEQSRTQGEPSEANLPGELPNDDPALHTSVSRTPMKSPPKKARSRKKVRQDLWKKDKRQKRRNEGREYVNKTGKLVSGATMGFICSEGCPLECKKLSEDQKLSLFKGFWDISSFDKQNAYLFGSIQVISVIRRYKKGALLQDKDFSKKVTCIYFVKAGGESYRVCKNTFLGIHGLQKHVGRVNNLIARIKENQNSPPVDKRGKHTTRPHSFSEESVQSVHEHIKSVPKYQSHYSRNQNPEKTYFGCDLNIARLRELYKSYCKERNIVPVSEDKYRRIFCQNFNIGFKLPASDTCKTCDSSEIVLKHGSEAEKRAAQKEKEFHLAFAAALRNKLKEMSILAKTDQTVHVITVDLQQTLPTPKLTCGPAFYCRKAWTYNVGIHECGQNVGHMFLWDESVAARGSDEIGSCILKYLTINNVRAVKLQVFSDNCSGQNKNWNIMALWSYLIHTKRFQEIEHYFLVPGHTYLPSDRNFGKIEKFQKGHPQVYSPGHWEEIIRSCGKKSKFSVVKMGTEDFFDFANLKNGLINSTKKNCIDGQPVNFIGAICYRFEREKPFVIQLKNRMNAKFIECELRKRGKATTIQLNQKYDGPKPIAKKKLEDIMSLLSYIPPIYHSYYNQLKADDKTTGENGDGDDNVELL